MGTIDSSSLTKERMKAMLAALDEIMSKRENEVFNESTKPILLRRMKKYLEHADILLWGKVLSEARSEFNKYRGHPSFIMLEHAFKKGIRKGELLEKYRNNNLTPAEEKEFLRELNKTSAKNAAEDRRKLWEFKDKRRIARDTRLVRKYMGRHPDDKDNAPLGDWKTWREGWVRFEIARGVPSTATVKITTSNEKEWKKLVRKGYFKKEANVVTYEVYSPFVKQFRDIPASNEPLIISSEGNILTIQRAYKELRITRRMVIYTLSEKYQEDTINKCYIYSGQATDMFYLPQYYRDAMRMNIYYLKEEDCIEEKKEK